MNASLPFNLCFDSERLRPIEVEMCILGLEREVLELDGVEKAANNQAVKEIDPLAFAILSFNLIPTVLARFFEFLNAWAMRRENRMVKIRVQLGKNKYVEFEGSETMSKKDVEGWVAAVEKTLKK
jgi:hypothetical protein